MRVAVRDALYAAKRADGAVDTINQEYRTVEGRLKEMHRAFAETEAFGVQTVRARKLAEVARQAYQERNLADVAKARSEEHTSELQSPCNLVCRLLLEKKKKK